MITQTERQFVKVTAADRIAVVTLDHPPVNALNGATLAELATVMDELGRDDEVGAIILTGAGPHTFVAGLDVQEMHEVLGTEGLSPEQHPIWHGREAFGSIEALSTPVIAAVNGLCLGAGLELVLTCHFRIGSDKASFQMPDIDLGLTPGFGGTQRLPRLIGSGRALSMLLTASSLGAHEAHRIGLLDRVVAEEALLREARGLAGNLVMRPASAVRSILQAVREGLTAGYQQGLELESKLFLESTTGDNGREGLRAFAEKRPPRFK